MLLVPTLRSTGAAVNEYRAYLPVLRRTFESKGAFTAVSSITIHAMNSTHKNNKL
jgi:hypothetical protein